ACSLGAAAFGMRWVWNASACWVFSDRCLFCVANIASLFFACEANTPLKNARYHNYKIILPVGQANFRTVEQAKFSDFLAGAPISDRLRHVNQSGTPSAVQPDARQLPHAGRGRPVAPA